MAIAKIGLANFATGGKNRWRHAPDNVLQLLACEVRQGRFV